jgi:3-hydroxyacyl-[acyl-carrier-protein] dehydratase
MNETSFKLDINQIQKYLPHRTPFLLIDKVLEIHATQDQVGSKVVSVKNVTFNEPFMQGHFPGFAIMPGVLIIEAMAQTAGMTLYPQAVKDLENFTKGFKLILVGVNSARFRKPVIPGDALKIETVVDKVRGKLWMFDCTATVDGERVAEAEIMANLMPNSEM